MLTERQDSMAIESGRNGVCEDDAGFTRWHVSQERTHLWMYLYIRGQ